MTSKILEVAEAYVKRPLRERLRIAWRCLINKCPMYICERCLQEWVYGEMSRVVHDELVKLAKVGEHEHANT